VYIATISCSCAPEAWRSTRRLGAAIARIEASMLAIACPASRITSSMGRSISPAAAAVLDIRARLKKSGGAT
jgi:hypothetical protein